MHTQDFERAYEAYGRSLAADPPHLSNANASELAYRLVLSLAPFLPFTLCASVSLYLLACVCVGGAVTKQRDG
jgi:hypothetical protein